MMKEAEKEAMRIGVNFRVRELKKEIDELVDKEYRMWFQRSKALWAANGDKNSKFFHCRATQRKRKNSILKIHKADGEWSLDMEQVTEALITYFKELVFKSKFFLDCSILEASNSYSGSYAWHSILKGWDILLKGARWRVGSEESISVWLDAWLPSLEHPRIQSYIVEGFKDIKVKDLIDPETRNWDDNLIQGLFNNQEVNLIKSIPLCPTPIADTLTWPFNALGSYTVKSGCKFLAKDELHNQSPTHSNQNNDLWKLIWGLEVLNKIKNFVWRSSKDAIPVRKNLKKRKILNDDKCKQCGQDEESVLHAIWECSKLSPIWDAIPEFACHQSRSFADIKDLLLYVSNAGSKVDLLAVIMWNIWYHRNQLRLNKDNPISQVIQTSQQCLLEYQKENRVQRTQMDTPAPTRVAWHPLPDGCVKINFNGPTFKDINKAGLGIIIRDGFGQVLTSLSKQIQLPYSLDG
ncbi:uncharacterized protein LOC112010585 [Quercus suber]|uniref:uncharacterized protein LOC112010585 n=1 Tax=Quercus suber TaxID=58331 RepID=UPI000CE234C9|nr:uncharacterized protein LOC112010585 [Quercus suber]